MSSRLKLDLDLRGSFVGTQYYVLDWCICAISRCSVHEAGALCWWQVLCAGKQVLSSVLQVKRHVLCAIGRCSVLEAYSQY